MKFHGRNNVRDRTHGRLVFLPVFACPSTVDPSFLKTIRNLRCGSTKVTSLPSGLSVSRVGGYRPDY